MSDRNGWIIFSIFRERWGLFSGLAFLISVLMVYCWLITGLSGEQEYRHMIRISVRCALPLLLMTFVASAARRLWPNNFTAWLLRNRKYIGLAFSAAMAWQIIFILLLISTGAEIFAPGPALAFIISDLIGYTLLLLMTFTSFDAIKGRMSPVLWRRLHRIAIYYIWMIFLYSFPIGIYFSRTNPVDIAGYFILFVVTLSAGILRLTAWGKFRFANSSKY